MHFSLQFRLFFLPWHVNHKRVYRLYCEEGLQLRNKTPKRKVSAKLREDRKPPERANEVWAMDFLPDGGPKTGASTNKPKTNLNHGPTFGGKVN